MNILRRIQAFISGGVVDYARHLKEMDDMKADYDLKLAMLKRRRTNSNKAEEV